MLEHIIIGSGLAFASGIQPGPLQAFLLSSVSQRGWKRTLPASFSPLISDGPIAVLTLLILNHVTDATSSILRAAGGLFLIYLAWRSYIQWKRQTPSGPDEGDSARRTLFQAVTVNVLNPYPYLGWSLVLGPLFLTSWHHQPTDALALLFSFYGTLVLVLGCTILLFGTTRYLGPTGRRTLVLVSAGVLAAIGIYQLAASITAVFKK
jgi:threonine/homoserine/homoserine lactone efflux protein